ncbi:MAG: hypothetical protein HS116_03610 [Planctomycetes bacterium]|nr:hypothetical protein [Planctomycetota bacterium]
MILVELSDVLSMVTKQLAQLGFSYRKKCCYSKSITKEITGLVVLNTVIRTKSGFSLFEVTPRIGVRHETLEALVAELRERKHDRNSVTIGERIGYLLEQRCDIQWCFVIKCSQSETEAMIANRAGWYGFELSTEGGVKSMVDAIERGSYKYFAQYSNIKSIAAALERRDGAVDFGRDGALPVALALAGRREKAVKFVQGMLARAKQSKVPYFVDFVPYGEAFLRMYEGSGAAQVIVKPPKEPEA